MLKENKFQDSVECVLENKHDIGMVCLHNNNYGNNLTNYALYQVLRNMGYSVALIDQARDAEWKPSDRKLALFAHVPYEESDLLASSADKTALKELNKMCSMFIVASDQLFRSIFVEGMDFHACLDWVSSDKFKMSYAASFGTDVFDGTPELKNKMKYCLDRFQAVSVREDTGAAILEKVFDIKGVCVADPVFLCNRKYYAEMAAYGTLRIPSVPYAGAYILDSSRVKEAAINEIRRQKEWMPYNIISDGEFEQQEVESRWDLKILSKPLVEEWLANILYSEIFITDSFHGLCFALIFNKDFFVITEDGNWRGRTRLESLLKKLGLEDRLIGSADDLNPDKINRHIDYEAVNVQLSRMVSTSKEWLIQQLEKGKSFCGKLETYDILGEKIDCNAKKIENAARSIDETTRTIHELRDAIDGIGYVQKQLVKRNDAQAGRIHELEVRLSNMREVNKNLEQRLMSIYDSNSWKVTRIFRTMKTALRKFLNTVSRPK